MFEQLYYINLDHRIDRREKFVKRASEAGLENVNRFSAISVTTEDCQPDYFNEGDKRRFKVGCTLSHQAVVRLAKEKNLKNILIFEDDCVFLDNFKETVMSCFNELRDLEWDIIYFGGEPSNHCTPIKDNTYLIENGGVYCNHCYAVNHTFYDKFLNINPYHTNVIDIALLNYPVSEKKFMLSKNIVAVQEDYMFSDLEQHDKKAASKIMLDGWSKYVTNSIFN